MATLGILCCLCRSVMVEGSGKEMSEDVVCEAVLLASKTVQPFLEALSEFQVKHGKQKREFKAFLPSEELYSTVKRYCIGCVRACMRARVCACVHVVQVDFLYQCSSLYLHVHCYSKDTGVYEGPQIQNLLRAPNFFIPQ